MEIDNKMKLLFKSFCLTILFAVIISGGSSIYAQNVAEEQEMLQTATISMVKWFKTLIDEISEIVEEEEKRDLIEGLTELKKDIYNLEQDKRFLLESLRQDEIFKYEIEVALQDMDKSLKNVRKKIRLVSLKLREQFREGGLEVEEQLLKATGRRKIWLSNLSDQIENDADLNLESIISSGEEAVQSLKEATMELSILIDKLRKT